MGGLCEAAVSFQLACAVQGNNLDVLHDCLSHVS